MSDGKTRWRMTFDELCHMSQTTPREIDRWAELGVFGPRYKEPRDRGWHRHVTRQQAQQARIMRFLLRAGIRDRVAAEAAATHKTNDTSVLALVNDNGILVTVDRSRLDLP